MAKKSQASTTWQNRIVGEGVEKADQLLANPMNFRIHPKNQQDAMTGVLNQVGWVQRVIVNKRTGHIVDGHLRVSLAISAGAQDVPVVYVDLTDAEEALILATLDPISAMAATDADKLRELMELVSTDEPAIGAMLAALAEDAGIIPDETPIIETDMPLSKPDELLLKWGVTVGDLWVIPSQRGGEHRIACGDSTKAEDVARLMGGEKADAIVTDPPYGVDYVGGHNATPRAKLIGDANAGLYRAFLREWMKHITQRAVIYVWFASSKGLEVYSAIHDTDLKVRALIIWNKIDAHYGNFMAQYMQKHEPCLYCVQDATDWYGPTNEVTVWDIKQPSINEYHPTQKPIECMARPITNSTTIGNVVADPFSGSGTTLVACEQLGRQCRAIELDPRYVAVALERLSLMGLTPYRVTPEGANNGA